MSFHELLNKDYADMLSLRESLGYGKEILPNSLTAFFQFCGNNSPDSECITKEIVDSWLGQKHWGAKSSHGRFISRLRTFAKYQNAMGQKSFIPSDDYNVSRSGRLMSTPFIFTDEELQKLFEAIDTLPPCRECPERPIVVPVIFRMMYCCGMRPQEPLSILCEDIDLNTGEIIIRQSKGRKDRRILMSADLTRLCRSYDSRRGSRTYFFETMDQKPYLVGWARRQLKICWSNCGFEERGRLRPYDLRHNFAARIMMRWVNEGRDVTEMASSLSAYMGHANFSDTLYYVHLLPESLTKSSGIDWARFSRIYPEVPNE